MKNIFYFHGLQSKQGGQKIDYLTKKYLVHAPEMIYKAPQTWQQTSKKVDAVKPQIIVGSSMGGLMGFYTGYKLQCKMLLFNPAFDRIPEYIDGWQCRSDDQKAQIQIVLGKNDKDVDPNKTIQYIETNKIKANITMLDMEHRISVQILTQEFERFEQKLLLT